MPNCAQLPVDSQRKPSEARLSQAPQQLGRSPQARRLDLGLTQGEVAAKLAEDAESIRNWESGRTNPAIRHYPLLIAFLGNDRFPEPPSTGNAIRRERERRGWSRRKFANLTGVDEASVRRPEVARTGVSPRVVQAIHDVFGRRADP